MSWTIEWLTSTPTASGTAPPTGVAAVFGAGADESGGNAVLDEVGRGFASEPHIRFRHLVVTDTAALAVSSDSYVEYAMVGANIETDEVSFLFAKGGASDPRGWELRASHDNYASTLATGVGVEAAPTWDPVVTVDTSALPPTTDLTFRLYIYTPSVGSVAYADEFTVSQTIDAVTLSITAPADGTIHNPSTEITAINWQLDTFGPTGDFEEFEIVVNNLTDGTTLELTNVHNWIAGVDAVAASAVYDPPLTVGNSSNHNLSATWDSEGADYEIKVRGRGTDNVWGPYDVVNVSTWTWDRAPDVTFTTLAGAATGTITGPADGFVIDEDETGFLITGTTTGNPTAVEVVVNNGTPIPVTDTGTNFSTWTVVPQFATEGIVPGDSITVDLEVDSVVADTIVGRLNEAPDVPTITSGIAVNQVLPPNSPLPTFTINVNDATDGIDIHRFVLRRLSDGLYWDGSAWVATGIWNHSTQTFTNAELPTTYTFEDGVDGVTFPSNLGVSTNYALTVNVRDTSGTFESTSRTRSFSTGAPAVTGTITSPLDGFVIDEDDSTFTVTGTATGAPSMVEVDANGTAFTATNTGTDFDTWTATVDRTAASLEDGDAVTLELLLDSVAADTVVGRINERPDAPVITSGITVDQVLPPNSALPLFTIPVNDATDGIELIRFRLQRLSDGLYWDGSVWVSSAVWNDSTQTYTNAELPATYTFQDGTDGIDFPLDLGVSTSYRIVTLIQDASGTNESSSTARTFSTGTPPTANADTYTVGQDTSTDLNVLANDDNVAAGAVITIVTQPSSGGTATVNP